MAIPHSWDYREVSATPTPEMESHLLEALRKLTSTLDVTGVCEAVLTPALMGSPAFRAALEAAYDKLAAPQSALTSELSA